MLHLKAAARPERQPVEVPVLLEVLGSPVGVAGDGRERIANREPADLPRRGHVALEEHRRDAERIGHVVEAVGGVVSGKKRVDVDVEREQIADRVAILGPVQTIEGGPPRVGMRFRLAGERAIEPGGQTAVRRFIRTAAAVWRHRPRPDFPQHLFPDLG